MLLSLIGLIGLMTAECGDVEERADTLKATYALIIFDDYLSHLSSDCNTGDLAKKALREICEKNEVELPTEVVVASQEEPTKWLEFGKQKLPVVKEGVEQGELF